MSDQLPVPAAGNTFERIKRVNQSGAVGSTELAANLFRATQTEEKLRRENVRNKDHANRIHNEVKKFARRFTS